MKKCNHFLYCCVALAFALLFSCSKNEEGPTKEELAQMKMPGYELTKEFFWYDLNGDKENEELGCDLNVLTSILQGFGANDSLDLEKDARLIRNDSVLLIRKDFSNSSGEDFSLVYWQRLYGNHCAYSVTVQTEQLNEQRAVYDADDYEPYVLSAGMHECNLYRFESYCNIRNNKMRVICFQTSE